MRRGPRPETVLLVLSAALFGVLLFKHLSYPLFWSDEADTAMFGTRVLEYGYPKVHGPRNVVYQFGPNIALGVKESVDAYIGTTWGHFYFAVPGLLFAERVEDPFAKTARVRLPFALAGALGLLLWLRAVTPALRGPRRRRLFAGLFLLLASCSISLILHLREVRYYALLVLLAGEIVRLHLGFTVYRKLGQRGYTLRQSILLVLLFHTFYTAWFSAVVLILGDCLLRRGRRLRAPGKRIRAELEVLAPVLVSAVCVAPALVFFETFHVAGAFTRGLAMGLGTWIANLGEIAAHFLGHEFLAPALVLRASVVGVDVWLQRRGLPPGDPGARRVALFLNLLVLGYMGLGALSPMALERYFVVLSPAVTLALLLDAFSLVDTLPRLVAPGLRSRVVVASVCALFALVAATRWPLLPDLTGRLHEIRHRYRGPLDFAIPYLRERYADPRELVIATNYEAQSFMYYLGSHVIVGLSLNNIRRDRALDPDVVVPRGRWPSSFRELAPFLGRGDYEEVRFPVADLHYNNVPALSRSRWIPDPHRFRTAESGDPATQLRLYERATPGLAERPSTGAKRSRKRDKTE